MTNTTSTTGGSSFLLPSGPTTIDSSVSNIPDYYQAYQSAILGTGNSLASQPYASYPGQTIANLTQDQLNAQNMVENNVNAAQPYQTQSGNLYNQVGSGFNQQAFNQYANPYESQVIGALTNASNTNFTNNAMPQLNSQFIGNGMYGGSRNAQILSQAADQNQQNLNNQIASTESTDYQNAMNAYQTGNNQTLASAQGLGALGEQVTNTNLTNASALNAIGQQQQNQDQTSLNAAYNNFQQQQQYPYQQLNFLSGLLSNNQAAIPYSTTQTANNNINTTNPLSILGSTALQLGEIKGGA